MATLATPSRSRASGKIVRLLVVILLVLATVFWGGRWLHYRFTHVHVTDARIKTDMISVASRLPARILDMPVTEGDTITRGQLLLTLDSAQVEQDLRVVEANRATLLGEQARLEAELALAEAVDASRITIARRTLETAAVELERRQLDLDKARADLNRLKGMSRNNMVSAQQLADAQYLVDSAETDLRSARAGRSSAEAALAEAEARALNQQVLRQDLESLEARLTEVEARQQRLALDVADHRVTSPVTGVVARTFVEPGEYIQAGQNLMIVYNPEQLWIEANIKETSFSRVHLGQPVRIRVDAFSAERFPGRVVRIGAAATSEFALLPSPNPSGNFTKTTQRIPVRIHFDEPDSRLRPGMMVEVGIHVADD